MGSGLLGLFVFRFHSVFIVVSIFGLLFRSQLPSLPPSDPAERAIWCESVGDLNAVQHAGNAGGEVVAARLGIMLRECGIVLRGAGLCVCSQ